MPLYEFLCPDKLILFANKYSNRPEGTVNMVFSVHINYLLKLICGESFQDFDSFSQDNIVTANANLEENINVISKYFIL